MPKLSQLKIAILEDGKIDAEEVQSLKKILYADGKIDTEEADFLFELNDACSEADNHPSWEEFFIEAICKYLLDDEHSPNVVDDNEANWLLEKVNKDGRLDDTEKKLLKRLTDRAQSIPDTLQSYISQAIQ